MRIVLMIYFDAVFGAVVKLVNIIGKVCVPAAIVKIEKATSLLYSFLWSLENV